MNSFDLNSFPSFLLRAAEKIVESGQQLLNARIGNPVPKCLTLAPEGDEPFGAHFGQMLRQSRLREANRFSQAADVSFAGLRKLAEHKQAPFIGNGAEDFRNFAGFCLKICCLHGHFHARFYFRCC